MFGGWKKTHHSFERMRLRGTMADRAYSITSSARATGNAANRKTRRLFVLGLPL
jgi:hypothetical protein